VNRIAVLVAHDEDANTHVRRLVDEQIGKTPQGKDCPTFAKRRSKSGFAHQQARYPVKFIEKACDQTTITARR